MILRWGRKGLVASALAVTFVTPVAVEPTTYINKVQYRPDIKLEFRHITPVGVVAEVETHTPGYYGVDGIISKRDKEEDEIIALIMAMYETGTLN